MFNKQRLPVVMVLALVAVAVFALAGLPYGQFGVANVQAQYAPSAESLCGAAVAFQVRFFGDVQAYADSGLTQPAVVLKQTGRSKWLICTASITRTSWAIFFVNRLLYVPAGTGEIVPREFRDNQP